MIDPTTLLEIDIKTYFTCLQCKLVLLEPQEKQCCGGLVCIECCNKYKIRNKNRCNQCNRDIEFNPNAFARRVLNQLKSIKCIYDCGEEHDFANLRAHLLDCQERLFNCQEIGCNFSGNKDKFKNHYIDNHDDEFFKMISKHKSKYVLKIKEKHNYVPFIPKDKSIISLQSNKESLMNSSAPFQNNNLNFIQSDNRNLNKETYNSKFGNLCPIYNDSFPKSIPYFLMNTNNNAKENTSNNIKENTNNNNKENNKKYTDNHHINFQVNNKQIDEYDNYSCTYSDYYDGYSYGSNSYSY